MSESDSFVWYWHVWHRLACLIHMCHIDWHVSFWFICVTLTCLLWLNSHVWHSSFIRVTWRIQIRAWYGSFVLVIWLIYMCDMSHSHACWVMSQLCIGHVTNCESVMSRTVNWSCHEVLIGHDRFTVETWLSMSRIRMSHVRLVNVSCHAYTWAVQCKNMSERETQIKFLLLL